MQIGQAPGPAKRIGPDHPVYVIAEIGVNHDGSEERARALVRAAAEAGADAIKLQLFEADRLMSAGSSLATYQREAGERDPRAMLRRLELSVDQMESIVALAHELGIHAIVTPFSAELVDLAEHLPFDAYKTASPDIIHRPLLERLIATGKPLIISTGASEPEEVQRALGWLEEAERGSLGRVALLQCVSSYPTSMAQAALGGVQALAQMFDGPVGYSDHTREVETGALAVAIGAHVLEKHLTYDRGAAGPDHSASLDPADLKQYVHLVRHMPRELRHTPAPHPDPVKRVLEIERDVRRVSRQSLVLARDGRAGERLAPGDLTVKRPGTGIPPFMLRQTIGRTLARDVRADHPLVEADLS
jgi:sialic acid synthase SpsE